MISYYWVFVIFLFQFALSAPPGTPSFFNRQPNEQQRSFGRVRRPSSFGGGEIEPGPQMGQSRARPSMGALQPPVQEQEIGGQSPRDLTGEPASFPDSPGPEGRRPQNGRPFPPGFSPRGPESAPFNAENNLFERQRGGGPILPVRPPNAPPLFPQTSNTIEESIPFPPAEETDQFGPNDQNSQNNQNSQNGSEMRGRGGSPTSARQDENSQIDQNNQNPPPGRGPILPVRPPSRTRGNAGMPRGEGQNGQNGQNWNISDAEAAGLIDGEDLNGSQEGRCVVCGPRNSFSVVDPISAQTARPNQIPDTSYEDETEAPGLPRRGPNTQSPGRSEMTPKEMFPSPEDLRLGDLAELAVNSLIRTCRTKLNCKQENLNARQKRNDIHRIELDMLRKYKPLESPSVVERRLDKIHMVKRFMLNAAGLAEVQPINDGTFQQDILLTEDQAEYLLHKLRIPIHGSRSKRAAIYMEQMPSQVWEFNKPIPYTFDPSMDPRDRQIIKVALRTIETSTCIRFVEYPNRPIETPTFCGLSYIGKISPANPIYLSFSCGDVVGVAIHETMHALGVIHEHLRVDRDKYLQLQWENINPQFFDYFAIGDPLAFTSYGVPFDYEVDRHHFKRYSYLRFSCEDFGLFVKMAESQIPANERPVLTLELPKELCSWSDNTALRRCALYDSYLTANITPCGAFLYLVYEYHVTVFNVFCGTTKEYPTSCELTTYLPIDKNSGYMIYIELSKLFVRKVLFDFASGFTEDLAEKRCILSDCEKIKNADAISYLKNTSELAVVYQDTDGNTNFRIFNLDTWTEVSICVEQFGNGDWTRFPFYSNSHAYAFHKYHYTTIKNSAERFGRICEVDPKKASTTPFQRLQQPAANRQVVVPVQEIPIAQQRLLIGQLQRRLREQRQQILAHAHAHDADIDLFGDDPHHLANELFQRHAFPNPPEAQPAVNANPPAPALPPRHRIIPLHNDLTCVGIPDSIANLPNALEKFEFQWNDQKLFLLWSVGVSRSQFNVALAEFYPRSDYDLSHDFFNFFAVFDFKNLLWRPIKINNLSMRTDSPLLMGISTDEFLTITVSQLAQPYRWSSLKSSPLANTPSKQTSILNISPESSFHSKLYRMGNSEARQPFQFGTSAV
ncbi:Metalloendopeptidase [Aphelenchoides bicaudatus]|nr:Metalloendopeptidase [Aphelenchoides bicaudatus]